METKIYSFDRLRIALVGAPRTGKTCFAHRIAHITDEKPLESTIGVDYITLNLEKSDGQRLPIKLWDCASNTKYANLVVQEFAPLMDGLIVFYDCSRTVTFEPSAKKWLEAIVPQMRNKPAVMVLATHTDEAKNSGLVEKGKSFCKENGYMFQQCCVTEDEEKYLEKFVIKVAEQVLLKNKDRFKRIYHTHEELTLYYEWLIPNFQ